MTKNLNRTYLQLTRIIYGAPDQYNYNSNNNYNNNNNNLILSQKYRTPSQ